MQIQNSLIGCSQPSRLYPPQARLIPRRHEKLANLYEGMFLLDSGKYAANSESTVNEVVGILENAGATIVAHREWLDGKLAYPVQGHRKGVHYLSYFRMPSSGVSQITQACKLSDVVLRHVVLKHTPTMFDAMVQAVEPGHGLEDERSEDEDESADDGDDDADSDDDDETSDE